MPERIAGQPAEAVIVGQAYDSDSNRRAIAEQGAQAVIPPRKNRTAAIEHDRHLHQERHMVERRFGKLKQRRRIATRYDKQAADFLGFVWPAATNIMLL